MKDKIKFIKELASSMNTNKIESVKYEDNNFEIEINKKSKEKRSVILGGTPTPQNLSQNQAITEVQENVVNVPQEIKEEAEIKGVKVESPMVGTYYASPSPELDPFIKEGDSVDEGQTLCIVEAMKLMNEIKSPVAGKVKKIMAKNGDAIKKGQVLVVIE